MTSTSTEIYAAELLSTKTVTYAAQVLTPDTAYISVTVMKILNLKLT